MTRSQAVLAISWIVGFVTVQPCVKPQDELKSSTLSASDSVIAPVQQLQTFYSSTRGLVGFMQSPRISGRGWKIGRESRMQLRNLLESCLEKRKAHIKAAEKLTTSDTEFWVKVISDELESELKLANAIDEILSPLEQQAYISENAKDLGATTFYSAIFWRLGKLSDEQQEKMLDKVKRQMLLRAKALQKPPSEFSATPRVNFLEGLSLKQLEVLFTLQARMDDDMTIEQYLELASAEERNFLAAANQDVRELLQEMDRE